MNSKDNWKPLWKKLQRDMKSLHKNAYGLVRGCSQLIDSEGFLKEFGGKEGATKELNTTLGVLCMNFTQAMGMLELFPKEEQWISGDLEDMKMQFVRKGLDERSKSKSKKATKEDKSSTESSEESTTRRRFGEIANTETAALAKAEDLEMENKHLRAKVAEQADKLIELTKEILALREELSSQLV